jgi:hypothetical protein
MNDLIKSNNSIARIDASDKVENNLLETRNDLFMIPYRKIDKWGFCDRNKKIVIPCIYDYVNFFIDGLAIVANYDKQFDSWKTYVIDIKKEKKFDLSYSWSPRDVKQHSFNLFEVEIDTYLKRLLNKNGEDIAEYCQIKQFKEDLAVVNDTDFVDAEDCEEQVHYYGVIDKYANEIITTKYRYIEDFNDGLAAIKLDKWGFINKNGVEVIPLIYDFVRSFSEGLAAVKSNSKWGFIDKNGVQIISYIYDDVRSFSEGLAAVKSNSKWGFINKNGELIISFKYERVNQFKEGFASVSNGVWGWWLIDKQGLSEKSNRLFCDNMGNTSEGLTGVKFSNKWGFLKNEGNFLVPVYEEISQFSEGLAAVKLNHKWGFINENGETIIPFIYEDIGNMFEMDVAVGGVSNSLENLLERKYLGYQDEYPTSGKLLDRDSLGSLNLDGFGFKDGLAIVRTEKGCGIIDKNGNQYFID